MSEPRLTVHSVRAWPTEIIREGILRVLVFLDTTEIMKDPLCSGASWRILAHRFKSWKVRVLVTEVVVEEAVEGYKRHLYDGGPVGLVNKLNERWGRTHGLSALAGEAIGKITSLAESYESRLHDLLEKA